MAQSEVTELVRAWYDGDAGAGERLFPLVYEELKRVAAAQLRHERGTTLQPTALVHEAYIRLFGTVESDEAGRASFDDRSRFFAYAATVMRHVLVDHARARLARKRAAGAKHLTLSTDLAAAGTREVELLDLDRALARLAGEHPRPARVVEMRFFAGLGEREIGSALGVTERTVKRDWAFARAWLLAALGEGSA